MTVKLNIELLEKPDDFLDFLIESNRSEKTLDVIATIPKGDFKHLSDKIVDPLAWWQSTRINSKSFREIFDFENSLFFICCSNLIVGFFYSGHGMPYCFGENFRQKEYRRGEFLSEYRYLDFPYEIGDEYTEEQKRELLVFPSTWCCIAPMTIKEVFGVDKNGNPKKIQGLKNMIPIEVSVLEQRESHKRVQSWRKDRRINPKSGRWIKDV